MVTPTAQDRLEIEVQDFGPIVHAKLDLRPMTVFIGPSNTGKSYLAILLYALHRLFSGRGDNVPGFGRFGLWRDWNLRSRAEELPKKAIADFEQLAREIASTGVAENSSEVVLPDGVMDVLRSSFSGLGQEAGTQVLRCFGLDEVRTLVRKGQNNRSCVVIRNGAAQNDANLEHTLLVSSQNVAFQPMIPERISIPSEGVGFALQRLCRHFDTTTDEFRRFEYLDWIGLLTDLVIPNMVGNLHLAGFYLPADRTGVMHAHSAVVSATLANVPMAGLQNTSGTPLLSGVLTDFLRELIYIDRGIGTPRTSRRRRSRRYDASTEIEKNILRGSIGIERSELINYPHFTYRPDGWKEDLPLMHASSMVSELAPVVLYLRHLVRPGNVLIIEEPESHLHPAAQVEFTRQLAKLVQQGYRIIITTHSEWILEELANVVQRSQLPPEELSTVSVSEAALTADQVGVWLFRPKTRPRGSEVVHVPLGEAGLYDSGFDDVAIALSNDGANIFDRIG